MWATSRSRSGAWRSGRSARRLRGARLAALCRAFMMGGHVGGKPDPRAGRRASLHGSRSSCSRLGLLRRRLAARCPVPDRPRARGRPGASPRAGPTRRGPFSSRRCGASSGLSSPGSGSRAPRSRWGTPARPSSRSRRPCRTIRATAASADLVGRTLLMLAQGLGEGGRAPGDHGGLDVPARRAARSDVPEARLPPRPRAPRRERAGSARVRSSSGRCRHDPARTQNARRALLIAYGRTGQDEPRPRARRDAAAAGRAGRSRSSSCPRPEPETLGVARMSPRLTRRPNSLTGS